MFINKALMLCNFPADKSEYRLDEIPTFMYACEVTIITLIIII